MLDNILNWLNKFFAGRPGNPQPDGRLIYVSPERALHELRGAAAEVSNAVEAKKRFVSFCLGGQDVGTDMTAEHLFRTAMETGRATMQGTWSKSNWHADRQCFSEFEHAAKRAGFRVAYSTWASDMGGVKYSLVVMAPVEDA